MVFGMSMVEIESVMGSPLRKSVNRRGEIDFSYDGYSVRFSKTEKRLVEVGFSRFCHITYDGLDIFETPEAFDQLIIKDGAPFEFYGFIILLNLGLTLTGFHDGNESQKAVTIFERGRWNELRAEMTPFKHMNEKDEPKTEPKTSYLDY